MADENTDDWDGLRLAADAYVAEHPDEFAQFEGKSLEELVRAVDVFREAGWVEEHLRVETWLWHHFEPQNIGGAAVVQVRNV
jgi:hypothetical protein